MATKDPTKPRHYPAAAGHTLTVWGADPTDPTKGVGANLHFGDAITTEDAWLTTRIDLSCREGPDGELQRWATADDGTARASRLSIGLEPDGGSWVSLNIAEADAEPAYLRIPFDDLLKFGRQQVYGPDPVARIEYDGPGGVKLAAYKGPIPSGRDHVGAFLSLGPPGQLDERGMPPSALLLNAFEMGDGSTAIGASFHDGSGKTGPITTILDEDGSVLLSVDVSPDGSGDLRQLTPAQVVELACEHGARIKPTVGVMRAGRFFPPGIAPKNG